jgi:glycerophosphoryl diester phosphodiesterase
MWCVVVRAQAATIHDAPLFHLFSPNPSSRVSNETGEMIKKIYTILAGLFLAGCGLIPASSDPVSEPPPTSENLTAHVFDVEGHRGARGLKPENTLPAFETALDLGVTTLELDLHYTQDRVVVIWHDDMVTADKCYLPSETMAPLPPDPEQSSTSETSLMISQLSLEQLQKYRCDRNPDVDKYPDQDNLPTALAGDGFRMVSLAELFTFVESYIISQDKSPTQRENAARVQFNLETKRKENNPQAINDGFDGVNPGLFEIAIADLISDFGMVDRAIVQSFDHRSLAVMHELNPKIRLATLTSRVNPDFTAYSDFGAIIWSPRYQDINSNLLKQAQEAGLKVIPWTVNDPDGMRRMISLGVDGIITDRPDLLLELELP